MELSLCAGSCCSCTSSRALSGAIAMRCCSPLIPLRLRCAATSTGPRKRADPYGEQHETIWAHKAPGTPGVCLGKGIRRCPMGGLVLVAPVSSDVLVWTADGSFYIHIHGAWPASSSEKVLAVFFSIPIPWGLRTRCIHRLMVGSFKLCKIWQNFHKQNLALEPGLR
jgi:hypothetical protein